MALASPFFCPMRDHTPEGIASSEVSISWPSCPWGSSQPADVVTADSSPRGLKQGLAQQRVLEGEAGGGMGQHLGFAGCGGAWVQQT